MNNWPHFALVVAAYLLGGLSPGYLLVRWRTGGDIRSHGSGGTGATNVGRVLGRRGFIVVFLLDLAKGALAVFAAQQLDAPAVWAYAVVLALIAGHVWPLLLGFRGGKGVGPLLGAWLALSPLALLPSLVVAVLALAVVRRFTIAGLCGLAVLPATVWWLTHERAFVGLTVASLAIVFFAHREHLRRWLHPDPATP